MEIASKLQADILFDVIKRDEYGLKELLKLGRDIKSVIDIGANFGIVSMFAKFLFPKAKVVAVEPVPETYKALERNVQHLNIITINKVFSDGRSLFIKRASDYQVHPGMNQCTEDVNNSDNKEEIMGTNLSQILNTFQIDPSDNCILKIDCEGGEKYLLEEGNIQYLKNISHIAGELHYNRGPNWPTKEECLQILQCLSETHDLSKTLLSDEAATMIARRKDLL